MSLTNPTNQLYYKHPQNNGDKMSDKMIQLKLPFPEEMTTMRAIDIADGFEECTDEEFIQAYQHLINTGIVWGLQGRFGRQAQRLIEGGLCTTSQTNNQTYSC